MVEIRPFKGYYYNFSKLNIPPERLVAPPYDVISGEMQKVLSEEPLNICNIMLGNKDDEYRSAGARFRKWIEDEAIIQDKDSCYYLYEQTYSFEGKIRQRMGLVALLKLKPLGTDILPHEMTHPKTKADRYQLLSAIQADIEQIFMIYEDRDDSLRPIFERARQPGNEILSYSDQNEVRHRVFQIPRDADIERITNLISSKSLMIADGHHRYETALKYSLEIDNKKGEGPHDYVLVNLVNSYDPGLIMLPTHRLIYSMDEKILGNLESGLSRRFDVQRVDDRVHLLGLLEGAEGCGSIGIWLVKEKKGFFVTLKSGLCSDDPVEKLDVSILHKYIIEEQFGITPEMQERKDKIEFVKGTEEAFKIASEQEYQVLCLLNASSIPEIFDAARTGRKLPHKSTYFYPKVWSGLVMYVF